MGSAHYQSHPICSWPTPPPFTLHLPHSSKVPVKVEFGPGSESPSNCRRENISVSLPNQDHNKGPCVVWKNWSTRDDNSPEELQVQLNGPCLLESNHGLSQEDNAFTHRGGRRLMQRSRQAQAVADHGAVEERT